MFIGYSWIRKANALGNLIFRPASLKNLHFQGITPIIDFGLGVQNTSNQSFNLQSFAGEIFANNYLVGNVSTFTPQTVSPNSQTIIYVEARFSPLGIVNDIINAIRNKTFSQTLELDAMANIDNQQVPIKLNYKFGK